jgi:excisionase family DNA binding protein
MSGVRRREHLKQPIRAEGHTNGSHALPVPDALLESLAVRVADLLAERFPETPEPYLTVEEAATYLACAPKRIYELKAQGRIAHFRDGKRLLFRREDLDAALRRREAE